MKRYFVLLLHVLPLGGIRAQENQTLTLTPRQIEARFLEQNLSLIGQKLEIEKADLQIREAKVWENPELAISSVNLWSTPGQREEEPIPGIWGNAGKNTQFSVELSQMIQSAYKRRKLVARERANRQVVLLEFDETLRSLRTELRQALIRVVYLQDLLRESRSQQLKLQEVTEAYRKQVQLGNLPKSELIRLQASAFEIEAEMLEEQSELNEWMCALRVLLNVDSSAGIEIGPAPLILLNPDEITPGSLESEALTFRSDLLLAEQMTDYFAKNIRYEKAQRLPDFTVSAAYDRRGGVWKDFVGFGVSAPLPLFNRNQNNIRSAKISYDQSLLDVRQLQNLVKNEVTESYRNYRNAYEFYIRANGSELFGELDGMLETYTRNLLARNIGMLEYMDFMEVFRNGKKTLLLARKNVEQTFEELQFTIGIPLK